MEAEDKEDITRGVYDPASAIGIKPAVTPVTAAPPLPPGPKPKQQLPAAP
jgi:hypothetical protein